MNATQSTIPAVQYEITVYEGFMDATHGGGTKIKEIFIPSYNIIINSGGGLFKSETPCNIEHPFMPHGAAPIVKPLKDINLPSDLVAKIASVGQLKFEIQKQEKELAPELKKLWK